MLNGCTYIVWKADPVKTTTMQAEAVDRDNVFALARTTVEQKELPAGSIIIIGEKYIYVLDSGGERLIELMKAVPDNRKLTATSENMRFVLKKNQKISGNLSLQYPKETGIDESMNKLRFYKGNDAYTTQIKLEGRIFSAQNNQLNLPQVSTFNHSYTITLHLEKTNINAKKLFENIMITPITLMGDVIVLPLVGAAALLQK